MIRFRKIHVYLTHDQCELLDFYLSGLDFLYNYYIRYNKKLYDENKDNPDKYTFMTDMEFNYFIRNELTLLDEYKWIKLIPSRPREMIIHDCFNAYKKFFNKKANPPKLKNRLNKSKSYYFTGAKISDDFNYIKVLGFDSPIKIIDVDYLKNFNYKRIISCRLVRRTNKNFYIVLKCEVDDIIQTNNFKTKISVCIGLQNYVTIYDGKNIYTKPNEIYNNLKILNIENKIANLTRIANIKLKINQKRKNLPFLNINTCGSNRINKIYEKIRKLYFRKENIINDYIFKLIKEILFTFKPRIIIIERIHLIKLLMSIESKDINKRIQDNKFYFFIERLRQSCEDFECEVRIPKKKDEYFKTCSKCGYKQNDIDIKELNFICPNCGLEIFKSHNNAINLYNISKYKL